MRRKLSDLQTTIHSELNTPACVRKHGAVFLESIRVSMTENPSHTNSRTGFLVNLRFSDSPACVRKHGDKFLSNLWKSMTGNRNYLRSDSGDKDRNVA
ncbi:hypothetical protein [Methylomonas sp. AM2-LC]|uniref:hypothetical protein n=1 Tax=Methylomonas sp. AM2-LC TaxID=3153301 RepID=UPI0032651F16